MSLLFQDFFYHVLNTQTQKREQTMNNTYKTLVIAALATFSTLGIGNNAAHAGLSFRMNKGVSYGEHGNMGIATQVENTATVDFNDLIPNQRGRRSNASFTNEFASYTFLNPGRSAVIADRWVPENINGTVNHNNPYLTVFKGADVEIKFNETANYFGLNWGSVSANNKISFYKGDTLIDAFQSAGHNAPNQAELNAVWQESKGSHRARNFWNEADAYLEFWAEDAGSVFDRIVLQQVSHAGGGFETDNHSFLLSNTGFDPDQNQSQSIPEPGMVLALLGVGGFMVRKRAKKA
ncbi:PEP-CTERM sorting domain-containing protein [Roseofilum sp. Guam]|uniref:Npun_F0296 family exosortase-dependent surface protein n=1 Tax=Roseofilum sp. Guam TaxID=2821502 RepID=UPI001B25E774|nr:PEP-CTERM sorting domain-containing protein [Roseofilum sp. Guam]MBP0029037.1 PEP-CTERM sorting domain-containing protein [Roseofilum sp. Guam]